MKKHNWYPALIAVLLCLTACGSKETERPTQPLPPLPTVTQPTSAPAKPTETEPTQPETTQPEPTEAAGGIRPEFKEAMDSYEAFYNEYFDFMEEYLKHPTDFSLLTRYASMLQRMEEFDKKYDAWEEDSMSSEELKYYLDVYTRIQKRLIDLF